MARELWIVDPSVQSAEREAVARVAALWSGPARIFVPALQPASQPSGADSESCGGVLVLGSGASVYDEHRPWLGPLAGWLRALLSQRPDLCVLGVCFGHQLLAHLLGAEVRQAPGGGKAVGVRTTSWLGGRLLPGGQPLRVLVSHREVVAQAPPNTRITAHRPGVAVDAFEHLERPWFGVQFHPEAEEAFAARRGLGRGPGARALHDGKRLLQGFFRQLRR